MTMRAWCGDCCLESEGKDMPTEPASVAAEWYAALIWESHDRCDELHICVRDVDGVRDFDVKVVVEPTFHATVRPPHGPRVPGGL